MIRIGTNRVSCKIRCEDCGATVETGEVADRCGNHWNTRFYGQPKHGSAKSLKHHFIPDPKYPWYCETCGYAEHEKLQHI